MVKMKFNGNGDAPHCANPNGWHNQEVNYPDVSNMNPRSYAKMESPKRVRYVLADASQMPKPSINPDKHKYASESELKSMKLVK